MYNLDWGRNFWSAVAQLEVKAPLDPVTMRLTAANVRPLLSRRTVAIYASAPCFSFGAVDEIEELGALATRRRIGLHVDCCLGVQRA